MKRLIILAGAMCCLLSTNAQTESSRWSLVPKVGANLIFSEPLDVLCGVTAGADIDWRVSSRIALSSGLSYSYQRYGFKEPISEPTNPVRDGRLVIPLMARAYVWQGLSLSAGIQANFRLHSGMSDHVDRQVVVPPIIEMNDRGNHISYTGTAMDATYFSLPVGISYEYRNFIIDVRYIFGLQNLRIHVNRTTDWFATTTHNTDVCWDSQKVNQLQLTLGYRIGL